MKNAYPIILTPEETGFSVYVPDLNINTQGENLSDAISMARDAIGLWGITKEDMKQTIPSPSDVRSLHHGPNEIVTLVDVDFSAYRRANDLRTVRKNVTIPSWLNDCAVKEDINFSQVLQEALRERLRV